MSNYPKTVYENDFSTIADTLYIPKGNDYISIQDNQGLQYAGILGLLVGNTTMFQSVLGFINPAVSIQQPGLLTTDYQLLVSLTATGVTNAATNDVVSGVYFDDFDGTTTYRYFLGIDQNFNFTLIQQLFLGSVYQSTNTKFKLALSVNPNSNIEFNLKYTYTTKRIDIITPLGGLLQLVLLNENVTHLYIYPFYPFAKLKLLVQLNNSTTLSIMSATYTSPNSINLQQTDAQLTTLQSDIVAIYTLKFWAANIISIPSVIDNNGTNYSPKALVVDNRNGGGSIIFTYQGVAYTIAIGNVFKMQIAGNYSDTLNFFSRRWGTAIAYVLGSNLNAIYQTF